MSVYLYEIHIRNFKSFVGTWKIGPLKSHSLCGIIGPNGTGKSNVIEAIAFCMGEQSINLRVTKLKDLINKSIDHRNRDAFVACVLESENGNNNIFKRSIIQNGSQYELDGKVITKQEYHKKLNDLRICMGAKNFIIYQNDINSIMLASAKERTIFFEQMSHSIDFKDQYDRLKNTFNELCDQIKEYQDEKKMLTADHRKLIYAQNEGKKLLGLQKQYEKTMTDSILFELYVIELQKNKITLDVEKMNEKKNKLDNDKLQIEEIIQGKKTQLLSLTDTATLIENKINKKQKKLDILTPDYFEIDEKIIKCEEKLKKTKKKLESAIKVDQSRERQIEQLSEELEEVIEAKKRFIENSSRLFDKNIEKVEEWDRKYDYLKGIVAKRVAIFQQKVNIIENEMQPLLNKLENEKRKRDEVKLNIDRKKLLNKENEKRISKMQNHIHETVEKMRILQDVNIELNENINLGNKKRHDLENDLKIIMDQCLECEIAKEQRNKITQDNYIVEMLQQSFSGVHDRVYKLLKPIHNRFKIPFTKVFGPYFTNIIVNDTETALKCIEYLRNDKIGYATFLPLDDNLQVKKLKESLRSFYQREGIKNVTLLYDVIDFEPEFERVVLHIAGNILVCETDDIAKHVAYNMPNNVQYNCVTLDGTYYKKGGLFSGGMVTLMEKSTLLKAAEYEKLEIKRNEIRENLKKIYTNMNNVDLQISNKEIEALQLTLKYYNKYFDTVKMECEKLDEEILKLSEDRQTVEDKIGSIELEINALNENIEAVQIEINKVEDEVFADFCVQVNIPNIRKYEQPLSVYREMKLKELEFDEQCARIEGLLAYEREKNTIHDVKKWQKNTNIIVEELEQLRDKEKNIKDIVNKIKTELDKYHNALTKTTSEIANLQKEIAKDEKSLRNICNCQMMLEEQSLGDKIMGTLESRHDILLRVKIHDISLPLLNDTLLDMTDLYILNHDCLTKRSLVDVYEQEEQYKFDYSHLKNKPKSVEEEIEIFQIREMYKTKLNELESSITTLETASKVSQELRTIKEKLKFIDDQLKMSLNINKDLKSDFEAIKKNRYDSFMKYFETAAQKVDEIYKEINGDTSAQALLYLENSEEPYLGGTYYDCTPPCKRFGKRNLSGGEIAIAALSLIFAIQCDNSSPFLLLDEIDAAFDQKNRKNVVSYIKSLKNRQQIIIISLHKELFSNSDILIGLYSIQGNSSSNFLMLDLPGFTNRVKSKIL